MHRLLQKASVDSAPKGEIMVRKRPLLAAAACGVVLGLGGIVAMDAATELADAQAEFTVSASQLRINQRISQAAVRRSNEALGLLGPVRPAESTDRKPVNPFASVARGSGWPAAALADGAVTSTKLSPELRAQVDAPVERTQQRTVRVTDKKTLGNSLNRTVVIPELTNAPAGDGYEVTFFATLLMDASSAGDKLSCEFTDGQGTAYGPTQYFTLVGGNDTVTMVGSRGTDAAGRSGVDVTCWSPDANMFFQNGSLSVISTPV
jgi:hypothetical protein